MDCAKRIVETLMGRAGHKGDVCEARHPGLNT